MTSSFSLRNMQMVAALVICLFAVFCSSCFIRNCPLGGKRSRPLAPVQAQRECIRCGPAGLGQCIGPNICCGNAIGCYVNTEESKMCQHENDLPTPCRVEGKQCGEGTCVADGLCCTDEGCRLDATCDIKQSERSNEDYNNSDLTPDLLNYVKRLLAEKAANYRRK